LLLDHFRLLCFLSFGEVNSFLDFTFFFLSLLLEHVILLGILFLTAVVELKVLDFLKLNIKKYLSDFILVFGFKNMNFISSFFGLLYLFPGFHFLLLKQGDTVSK